MMAQGATSPALREDILMKIVGTFFLYFIFNA